jgi:hypothetical protein
MRAVAKEAAGRRIRVNTLHPGPMANGGPPAPLGRHSQADEVARSVLYLASPMSSFTTASTLVVDGGLSASQSGSLPGRMIESSRWASPSVVSVVSDVPPFSSPPVWSSPTGPSVVSGDSR